MQNFKQMQRKLAIKKAHLLLDRIERNVDSMIAIAKQAQNKTAA